MRQIKFRMWDGRQMYQPELADEYDFFIGADGDCRRLVDSGTYNGAYYPTTIPNPCELMQFTGILDKNEKEIYEGDIVKTPKGDLRKIIYEFNSFKTVPLDDNFKDDTVWYYNVEIIGNIHENKQ